ncbi:hypothetical protein DFJ73DRAFT_390582 [Zopfochytrium polystomum]|nr:hypothetical protein DFJ73DRAFT_390582 [Zopfochytrium polystomum]
MGVVNVGVALGTVYAGLIGNELRMDGTVLGATVNLAARLMCAEMSAGENRSGFADVRVCCDEATFRACHAEFEFDTSRPKLLLKGFSDSVSYYPLIRSKEGQPKNSTRSAGQELFGREAEMELLDQSVKRWRDGELNQRVMVTGRSGLGKSALVEHIIQKVEDDSNTISWVCAAHEMRQKSSFAFLGSMLRSLILRLMAKDISPSRFSSARRASRASLGDSSIGTYDSQSLGQSDSEDSVSLFVLETVRLVGKGSIGALGAVPGFRWVKNIPVTSNDVSLTLSSFFAQLLHLIHDLGYSLHIVCDDAQVLLEA